MIDVALIPAEIRGSVRQAEAYSVEQWAAISREGGPHFKALALIFTQMSEAQRAQHLRSTGSEVRRIIRDMERRGTKGAAIFTLYCLSQEALERAVSSFYNPARKLAKSRRPKQPPAAPQRSRAALFCSDKMPPRVGARGEVRVRRGFGVVPPALASLIVPRLDAMKPQPVAAKWSDPAVPTA